MRCELRLSGAARTRLRDRVSAAARPLRLSRPGLGSARSPICTIATCANGPSAATRRRVGTPPRTLPGASRASGPIRCRRRRSSALRRTKTPSSRRGSPSAWRRWRSWPRADGGALARGPGRSACPLRALDRRRTQEARRSCRHGAAKRANADRRDGDGKGPDRDRHRHSGRATPRRGRPSAS